jgi:hypothetical protein
MVEVMEHVENMSTEAAVMPRSGRWVRLPTEPLARRVEQLRRAYQHALGRRPTTIERADMLKAALLVAKAEQLALDPRTDVHELVKLTNLADRAVRRLGFDGLHRRRSARSPGLALARLRWEEAAEREANRKSTSDLNASSGTTEPPDGR